MQARKISWIVSVVVAAVACPAGLAQGVPPPRPEWSSGFAADTPPAPPGAPALTAPSAFAAFAASPSPAPQRPAASTNSPLSGPQNSWALSPTPSAQLAPPQAQPQLLPPPAYAPPQAPPACAGCTAAPFTPYMLGDFVGTVANQFSDVKIAEGESPRPVDRVFYKFNYYNNLNKPRWADPTEPIHNVDLYRHTFGLETTFLDRRASLGLRIPFYTLDAEAKDVLFGVDPATGALVQVPRGTGLNTTHFGNVSAIGKLILCEDRETGSLVSGGITISMPTASSRLINLGQSTVAFIQPFFGFILNRGDFFVQGFSSITAPLVSAESIVLFTDVGVGYYAYRNAGGMLTAVVPTVEFHMANPLRQVDPDVEIF